MSKKVLLASVGGSIEPIITAIKKIKPNFVYFLCSEDGPKSPGSYTSIEGGGTETIPIKTNLSLNQYETILLKADDLNNSYERIQQLLSKLFQEDKDIDVTIDYTGGTKSMSGALLLASSEYQQITISIVTGDRTDLTKVKDGTQNVRLKRQNLPYIKAQKDFAKHFISVFDYRAAAEILDNILLIPDLPDPLYTENTRLLDLCKAFSFWDDFDHTAALDLLKDHKLNYSAHVLFLTKIIKCRDYISSRTTNQELKTILPGDGFEVVEDLILNAERKFLQQRYDDAVGRLYRATELFAQIRLLIEFDQFTSNIQVATLPVSLQSHYEEFKRNNKIAIGLLDSYKLLFDLNDPIIKPLYVAQNKSILKALSTRNNSILAHGFTTIDKIKYSIVYDELIKKMVLPALAAIREKCSFKSKDFFEQSNLDKQLPRTL